MRAMGAMRAPMLGRLRNNEIAPGLESSGALRKVNNEVFWPVKPGGNSANQNVY